MARPKHYDQYTSEFDDTPEFENIPRFDARGGFREIYARTGWSVDDAEFAYGSFGGRDIVAHYNRFDLRHDGAKTAVLLEDLGPSKCVSTAVRDGIIDFIDNLEFQGYKLTEIAHAVRDVVSAVKPDLQHADHSNADLSNENFVEAHIKNVNFTNANLENAKFMNSTIDATTCFNKADMRKANLRDADFSGVDLRDADLRGARLLRTNMAKTDLRGVKLNGNELAGAGINLDGARVDKELASMIVTYTPKPPQNLIIDKEYKRETQLQNTQKHTVSVLQQNAKKCVELDRKDSGVSIAD